MPATVVIFSCQILRFSISLKYSASTEKSPQPGHQVGWSAAMSFLVSGLRSGSSAVAEGAPLATAGTFPRWGISIVSFIVSSVFWRLFAQNQRPRQMICLSARRISHERFEIFDGFLERIEGPVVPDERRCVIEVLRDARAAGRTILHLEVAAAQPDVEPTGSRRKRVQIDTRLREFVHKGADQFLELHWDLHWVTPSF